MITLVRVLLNWPLDNSPFVTLSTELLKVIRETENDDLTGVMQKLISTYGDQHQVASIAVDIARDLVCIHCAMYKIDCYPNNAFFNSRFKLIILYLMHAFHDLMLFDKTILI